MVDSAHNWTAGLSHLPLSLLPRPHERSLPGFRKANHNTIKAKLDLVIPEKVSVASLSLSSVHTLISCKGNLTLDDGMCPNAKEGKESKTWLKIYAGSIEKRLNAAAPGAHLKEKDTHSLMSLCAFHSQALMAPSPFCGLFSAEEFTEYSYHSDLAKFYTNGSAYFPFSGLCHQPNLPF